MERVTSICPYCGIGCKLDYILDGNEIVDIKPNEEDEVSLGKPCIKGLTVHETVDEGRFTSPMIEKNGEMREVGWEEALQYIYDNTKDLAPDEVFLNMSGKITNEDDFIIQKFGRICFKTNNIDSCCGRLCHAATVKGMKDCFGAANLTKTKNIEDTDCLFIIGSDPANNYPVFNDRILDRIEDMMVISVESIHNKTYNQSDLHLVPKPGTEVALLNGIINALIEQGNYREEVEELDGFERMVDVASDYDKEYVCEECEIREEIFDEVVDAIAGSKNFSVFHGMGFTQHVNSIENIHSLLNLMILKQGDILTQRGEINVQGVGDVGCVPTSLPTGNFTTESELEELWGCEISDEKGKNIMEALLLSPVKAAFVVSFNPAQSMPNLKEVRKNLEEMFLVYCGPYENETSEYADVILPTPILPEREGTITNGERRIRKVNKVRDPKGGAKPDWEIFLELSSYYGKFEVIDHESTKGILKEIRDVVPDYSEIDINKIYKGEDGRARQEKKYERFQPEHFPGVDDVRSEQYPYILTTFRSPYQFLTGEMSSKSEKLDKLSDDPCFYIGPEDAERLGLKDGDRVKVTSPVSSLTSVAQIDDSIPKGTVGATFHERKLLVNELVPTQFDQESFTPNYKAVAVRVKKV
ncbi:MAG: molybdopterin oxidoreductase family protein [Candidatus Aenigmatarchaeota archaeon]